MNWNSPPKELGPSAWQIPSVSQWPKNDVIFQGADLQPETIVDAYAHGVFPMAMNRELQGVRSTADHDLAWWSPMRRGILELTDLRVTRSMRRSARRYVVRTNTCFELVMRGCAAPYREDGWINEDFIAAYLKLHNLGWAHSFEVIDENGFLVGGLYGVRVGGMFAGESMFHILRDASKVALMKLVEVMRDSRMSLLDVQWLTPHLQSLGAIAIPRKQYLARLALAVSQGYLPSLNK